MLLYLILFRLETTHNLPSPKPLTQGNEQSSFKVFSLFLVWLPSALTIIGFEWSFIRAFCRRATACKAIPKQKLFHIEVEMHVELKLWTSIKPETRHIHILTVCTYMSIFSNLNQLNLLHCHHFNLIMGLFKINYNIFCNSSLSSISFYVQNNNS